MKSYARSEDQLLNCERPEKIIVRVISIWTYYIVGISAAYILRSERSEIQKAAAYDQDHFHKCKTHGLSRGVDVVGRRQTRNTIFHSPTSIQGVTLEFFQFQPRASTLSHTDQQSSYTCRKQKSIIIDLDFLFRRSRASPNTSPDSPAESFRFCNSDISRCTMERPELAESPRKRQKVDSIPETDGAADVPVIGATATGEDAHLTKEREVGITELVTADTEGFSGLLKKR